MDARYGWDSDFGVFTTADGDEVIRALQSFVRDASTSQVTAWGDEVSLLQAEGREVISADAAAAKFRAILEYQLPLEARRPDVILLQNGNVLVLEFKSKDVPTSADIDQVSAYARDLASYHRECENRPVHAVLVPIRYAGQSMTINGTHVANPKHLAELITQLAREKATPLARDAFLADDAYRPLPSLVRAARELFETRTVRNVWRARASTDPAVNLITEITHEAARTKTNRLILLTGMPGSGKTLVGLRAVHAGFLDDLTIERKAGKPTSPAIFLSGNGPLVEVLQYELRRAGSDGRTFVKGVKNYVEAYSKRPNAVPPEHFLVFDEAQRAWDAEQVAEKHGGLADKSEPEHFIEFAGRIPEWCVVLGLIGTGQEIHKGEEGGIGQWRKAVDGAKDPSRWTIHAPPQLSEIFHSRNTRFNPALNLETEVRFHLISEVHNLVDGILQNALPKDTATLAQQLRNETYPIYVTRDLDKAKKYVRERYREDPNARFGLLASARDKDLPAYGILNDFQSTKLLKVGPWFSEGAENEHSCRNLIRPATEFQAQGLELDFAIVCWGSDFIRENGRWTDRLAKGFKRGTKVRDPFQLRLNSYRVLLTRGRDGMVLWVPPHQKWDETFQHFRTAGLAELID